MMVLHTLLYYSFLSLFHCCTYLQAFVFFFINDTANTEIYTLSLHDALPIFGVGKGDTNISGVLNYYHRNSIANREDRKSTRLNSSHLGISYAVFCLKKKIYIIRLSYVSSVAALNISAP